jgi:hypothetical protein
MKHVFIPTPRPWRSRAIRVLIILITVLLATQSVLAGGGGLDIARYVIGGGGGYAQSGPYTLEATIGQPIAGDTPAAATYVLCTGFWCGLGLYQVHLPILLRN